MQESQQFQWIIGLLLTNIGTVLIVGWKLSRYFTKMESKVNMMWADYEKAHSISSGMM